MNEPEKPNGGFDYLPEGTFESGSTDFGNWEPRIFFNEGSSKPLVPFWEWLREQRKSLRMTWRELEARCDVVRMPQYAGKISGGHPNEPNRGKFKLIVEGLGYDLNQFSHNTTIRRRSGGSVPEKGTPEYTAKLHVLGKFILERTKELAAEGKSPQLLSCALRIRDVVGTNFFARYASTYEERKDLLQELYELDVAYKEIKLQHQEQDRGKQRKATLYEKWYFETQILDHMKEVEKNGDGKEINVAEINRDTQKGLSKIVEDMFIIQGDRRIELGMEDDLREDDEKYFQVRTESSIAYQLSTLLKLKKDTKALGYGSPKPVPVIEKEEEPKNKIISRVDALITTLDDFDKTDEKSDIDDEEPPIIKPDEGNERRKHYLEKSLYGHQAIIAYLMEKEHYQTLLGDDAKLIAVDFSEDDTPHELFDEFKDLRDEVQADTEEEAIMDFVDGWIRCDMVFRTDIKYIVLEIK